MDVTEHVNMPIAPTAGADAGKDVLPSEENTVKLWRNRIREAKRFFEDDFKRMRDNMEFAAGLQWEGQTKLDDADQRYTANFITKHINDKVASLYAKNPKCEAVLRKRMDYQLWDGTVESEWAAAMAVQGAQMMGMMTPQALQAAALLQDIQQGRMREQQLKRVGQTLETLYEYQCDIQQPSFKFQMKQLVRRVITTGVGFVRLNYVDEFEHVTSPTTTDDSWAFRAKRVQDIMGQLAADTIQQDDPRVEQLRQLLESLQYSVQEGDLTNIEEHLEFSFPDSTAIIVDPKCNSLKGFTGAKWLAQEHIMSLEDANAYFELRGEERVTTGGDFVQYTNDGIELRQGTQAENQPKDVQSTPLGCFWEVFDLTTKETFWICDGWRWFVQNPAPVTPCTNRFWPIFSLTFNDIVVEPGQKAHIYPPSDVQILKPIQKERNRTRDELKKHREVNRPFFGALNNTIEPEDQDKLANHETGELILFKRVPQMANGGEDLENALFTWKGTEIDKNVYDTAPLEQDASLSIGSNQIQQGLSIRHIAATPAVIQEQARMSGTSSNVDDLDDLLSELACAAGEMMIRVFKPQTVQRITGFGMLPQENKEDFLNGVFLSVQAASSGRPNRAVDIQNVQQLGPLMMQAGANPIAMIEYYASILDPNLDVSKFFPTAPPMQPAGAPQQQPQKPQNPQVHNQQPGRVGQQQGGMGLMPGVQQGGPH